MLTSRRFLLIASSIPVRLSGFARYAITHTKALLVAAHVCSSRSLIKRGRLKHSFIAHVQTLLSLKKLDTGSDGGTLLRVLLMASKELLSLWHCSTHWSNCAGMSRAFRDAGWLHPVSGGPYYCHELTSWRKTSLLTTAVFHSLSSVFWHNLFTCIVLSFFLFLVLTKYDGTLCVLCKIVNFSRHSRYTYLQSKT